MISLSSPVRTRAQDWPAGAKLAALALATTALFLLPGLWVQIVALAVRTVVFIAVSCFLSRGAR